MHSRCVHLSALLAHVSRLYLLAARIMTHTCTFSGASCCDNGTYIRVMQQHVSRTIIIFRLCGNNSRARSQGFQLCCTFAADHQRLKLLFQEAQTP
jgi:hypothetical protein